VAAQTVPSLSRERALWADGHAVVVGVDQVTKSLALAHLHRPVHLVGPLGLGRELDALDAHVDADRAALALRLARAGRDGRHAVRPDVAVVEAAGEVELERRDADVGAGAGRAALRRRPDDHLVGFGVLAQPVEPRLDRAGRQAGQVVRLAVRLEPGGERGAHLGREHQA